MASHSQKKLNRSEKLKKNKTNKGKIQKKKQQ